MTWQQLIADYLEFLKVRHYKDNTIALLGHWLLRFADFSQAAGVSTPAAVMPDHIDAFHNHLLWCTGKTGLYLPTTVDQGMRAVRGWFRWAVLEQRLLVDPSRHLVLHRAPRRSPMILTVEEMERVLDVPNTETPVGLRDRAVLEVLYSTGMRRGECCGLDVDDLDFHRSAILVRKSKGDRQRLVPLGDSLADILKRYLADARPVLARKTGEPALFLSTHGTRFSLESTTQLVKETAKRVGLSLTTHAIRHAFATHMLEEGADVRDIKRLLGHENLQSTGIYTRVRRNELRKTHRRSHPRSA